jgi:hypothetical protein
VANVQSLKGAIEQLQHDRKGQRFPKGCNTKSQWMLRLVKDRELCRAYIRGDMTRAEYEDKRACLGSLFPAPTPEEIEGIEFQQSQLHQAFKAAMANEEKRLADIAASKASKPAEGEPVAVGPFMEQHFEQAPKRKRAKLSEQFEADEINAAMEREQLGIPDRLADYRGSTDGTETGEVYFQPEAP